MANGVFVAESRAYGVATQPTLLAMANKIQTRGYFGKTMQLRWPPRPRRRHPPQFFQIVVIAPPVFPLTHPPTRNPPPPPPPAARRHYWTRYGEIYACVLHSRHHMCGQARVGLVMAPLQVHHLAV